MMQKQQQNSEAEDFMCYSLVQQPSRDLRDASVPWEALYPERGAVGYGPKKKQKLSCILFRTKTEISGNK